MKMQSLNRRRLRVAQSAVRGFTLLELLIVIGIVGVLISILALGGKAVVGGIKKRTTRTAIENVLSLQTNYEVSGAKVSALFPANYMIRADHLGGLLGDEHYGSHDIYTQRAARTMAKSPKVKEIIAKMSADSLEDVVPFWEHDPGSPPGETNDNFSWFRPIGGGGNHFVHLTINYLVGDVVKVREQTNPNVLLYYVCNAKTPNDVGAAPPKTAPGPPGTVTGFWTYHGTTNRTPAFVPRDAWGRGIRFIGPAGLQYVFGSPGSSSGRNWWGPTNPDDHAFPEYYTATPNGDAAKDYRDHIMRASVVSTDGKAYWVSAGPDGDFATHDDNIYSFEN